MGNHTKFDQIALIDLPHLRERMHSAVFRPSNGEHLGFVEGVKPPGLVVSEWWTPGEQVDLGGRTLTVIHAPGHTPESLMLLDRDRGLLFTGDYIYEGLLLAFLPGSDLNEYLHTARHLLEYSPLGHPASRGAPRDTAWGSDPWLCGFSPSPSRT